jgi:beta-lactamase regulating signal transducer with metallopeptidase domain
MNDLFLFAARNTLVALLFALFVYGLTRIWRNPPVAHVLWLLVLLKLVAPPVMRVEWSEFWPLAPIHAEVHAVVDESRIAGRKTETHVGFVDRTTIQAPAQQEVSDFQRPGHAAGMRQLWLRTRSVLIVLWFGGAAMCACVAVMRILRFERRLRDALPATERLQQLIFEIACQLGVRRVPQVRYADCIEVPFVWCACRRATIVLPMRLLDQLDDQRLALILTHELAHLRRRDHWVRHIELIVSIAYWWNPLVWLIRRQIHQTEELCCDAWVRRAFPECTKRYAELLLQTAESLTASQVRTSLLPASPFLRSHSLKARIEMILENRSSPSVSTRSKFVIALLALFVLPSFLGIAKSEVRADSSEGVPAASVRKSEKPITSDFPFAVEFEQGATRLLDGDKITILEVRGTSDKFAPGNIYLIKGTYKLGSHDRATLAAYTTAMDAANGTSFSYKAQTTIVDQGEGAFTFFFPMSYRGWPHVSFYPADGGSSFGGNYFGTGDSVLKEWWGSKTRKRVD